MQHGRNGQNGQHGRGVPGGAHAAFRRPYVFLAMPARPGEGVAPGLWTATQPGNMGTGFDLYDACHQPMSLLTTNFNTLWCLARNTRTAWFLGHAAAAASKPRAANPYAGERFARGWDEGWDFAAWEHGGGAGPAPPGPLTDFVMAHSDVCPQPGRWLQDGLLERRRAGADILSCVIPLKDEDGMTSTGVMRWDSREIKKLSLRQCLHDLPPTFTARDAGADCLLVNTGLWFADLAGAWTRKVCFRIYDTVLEDADGIARAVAVGEDWLLGMDAYRLGLKVCATTKISILHLGQFAYPNAVAWGTRKGEDEWGTPWCTEPPAHWRWQAGAGLPEGAARAAPALTPA